MTTKVYTPVNNPLDLAQFLGRKRVYVAGPIGNPNKLPQERIEANVRKAIQVGKTLLDAGYAPFVPHFTIWFPESHNVDQGVWMEMDLPWVSVSDYVCRIPGDSPGSDIEEMYAGLIGVPVVSEEWLLKRAGVMAP